MIRLNGKDGDILVDHRDIRTAMEQQGKESKYTVINTDRTSFVVYNTPYEIQRKIRDYEQRR